MKTLCFEKKDQVESLSSENEFRSVQVKKIPFSMSRVFLSL